MIVSAPGVPGATGGGGGGGGVTTSSCPAIVKPELLSDGHVIYALRSSAVVRAFGWTGAQTKIRSFVHLLKREVPCGWMSEGMGAG